MRKKIFIIEAIVFVIGVTFLIVNYSNKKEEKPIKKDNSAEILGHFNEFSKTNKETDLYELKAGKYQTIGKISKDINLELINLSESEYFKIKNTDYYIHYLDVIISKREELDTRYKDYIVWNENVVTKSPTKFYDVNDNLVFSLNKSFDLPIIIKEENKYGVEYNNKFYYVKDIDTLKESSNTEVETRNNIRTFTYHTVYDPKTQKCAGIEICHPISQFEEQLNYLSENNYLTLTLKEVEMFLDKKIRIPLKTVALTLDDGIFLENSVPLVEKYKIYATFFIITSKRDVTEYLPLKYAKFESHSHDLHNNYKCPKNRASSQGGQMLCEKEENIIADLKLSQEKLQGSDYFAYPFFDFNDQAISALKKAGFKMAFIGQWDTKGYSTYDTDRFMVRRKTIFGNLKLNGFIEYLE